MRDPLALNHSVMAGHSPSKTGVTALMPGHPRFFAKPKTWMPGTRPGMTEQVGQAEWESR